jgi:tellurite resistance protein TerC
MVSGVTDLLYWAGLCLAVIVFMEIDLRRFARDREPTFREGVVWSIGWLVVSLAAGLVIFGLRGEEDAIVYTTVYLVERSLSLDNLFVFLLLFSYFSVPARHRAKLLFIGIVAALGLRLAAILGGVALLERFHFVIYLLAAGLLILAVRIFKGVEENVDPDRNLMVRVVRRFMPVSSSAAGGSYVKRENGRHHATPLLLCLAAVVFADIAFAIDSIPAAFGITRDPFLIFMGNVFALLGLRALFVLVEGLVRRFRYLDETIAVVLGAVAVKLFVAEWVAVGPLASLAIVAVLFGIGIVASLVADKRDPDADERKAERARRAAGAEAG